MIFDLDLLEGVKLEDFVRFEGVLGLWLGSDGHVTY